MSETKHAMTMRNDRLTEERIAYEKEIQDLQCQLGDLRDLISELVVDVENGRFPKFLWELIAKYRELYPLAETDFCLAGNPAIGGHCGDPDCVCGSKPENCGNQSGQISYEILAAWLGAACLGLAAYGVLWACHTWAGNTLATALQVLP